MENNLVEFSVLVGVYGSLKKGKYNHSALKDCELVGTTKVKGTLYAVSSYPALLDEGDNFYDLEVYKITDPILYQRIQRMEIGAGYIEKEVTSPDIDGVYIVYFAGDRLAQYLKEKKSIIESY